MTVFTIRRNGETLTGRANTHGWSWADDEASDRARRASYGARPGDRKDSVLQAMRRAAKGALARAGEECYF